jgi:hypothetical protein
MAHSAPMLTGKNDGKTAPDNRQWRKRPEVREIVRRPLVRNAIDSIRTILYFGTKAFRRPFLRHFMFDGRQYDYFYSRYNFTYRNERIVEIPLGLEAFNSVPPHAVLEIGNVLGHYHSISHDVVDKYESAPEVFNEDVERFDTSKRYQLIICISTLEHVGWDSPEEKDAGKISRSIANLKRLLVPGGELLITTPLGHNDFLDELIESEELPIRGSFLKRISWMNTWKEVPYEEVRGIQYDSPFPAANALFVGRYRKQDGEI